MKTSALTSGNATLLSLVAAKNNQPAKVLYGVNGYSKIKEIFSIRPIPVKINELEFYILEAERNDPNWFSSYE